MKCFPDRKWCAWPAAPAADLPVAPVDATVLAEDEAPLATSSLLAEVSSFRELDSRPEKWTLLIDGKLVGVGAKRLLLSPSSGT